MAQSSKKPPMTWRVRGIDPACNRECLRDMAAPISGAASDTVAPEIRVHSLALDPDERFQTATVTFDRPIASRNLRKCAKHGSGHDVEHSSGPELDKDFLGLTTLYAPPPHEHLIDIFAISGLGGHAFGSFRERGGEHMWLRDALPKDLGAPTQTERHTESFNGPPMARIVVFGYASPVANSTSLQNVDDLAKQVYQALLALCTSTGQRNAPRPIVIISHSLGGLVVKQAVISIARSKEIGAGRLRDSLHSLIFFGVPHSGMDNSSLVPMVGLGSPNMELVLSIGQSNSYFLNRQAIDFPDALEQLGRHRARPALFCFYETEASPTAALKDGKWEMSGPDAYLVSVRSATDCIPPQERDACTSPIARQHSAMVKYSLHDHVYDAVVQIIRRLASRAINPSSAIKTTSIIPMMRNANFIGREPILEKLDTMCFPHDASSNDEGTVALVSLGGLGGIGKTQVALEFSYWVRDNKPDYSIFWVSALSMDAFRQSCSEIVDELGITSGQDGHDHDATELLKKHLSTSPEVGKWLLVVDNADDVDLAEEIRCYLPHSSIGITLVTTRNEGVAWAISTNPSLISLDVMSKDEGRHLLKRLLLAERVPDQRDALCDELLGALEMLPLAITQAAACLNQNYISIQDYLDLWHSREQEARRLMEFKSSSIQEWPPEMQQQKQHRRTVMTTWLVSLEQITRYEGGGNTATTPGPTVQLLMFLSRAEPKAIPRTMLPVVGDSAVVLTNVIGTLLRYALLTKREDDVYDMHSLVHLAIRSWVDQQQLGDAATIMALGSLREKTKHMSDGSRCSSSKLGRILLMSYLPHALRVLADSTDVQSRDRSWLARRISARLDGQGRYDDALKWYLVYVQGAVYSTGSNGWAEGQYSLARMYRRARQPEDALRVANAAVASIRKTRSPNDKWLIRAQQQYALALSDLGHDRQAIKVLDEAANQLNTDHPAWADVHGKLASCHYAKGDYDIAIDIYIRVLDTIQNTRNPYHHDSVLFKRNLARAYIKADRASDAIPLLKHVLAACEAKYPANSYSVLRTQQRLARALLGNNEPAQALTSLQQAVQQMTKTLPSDHRAVLDSRYYLAEAFLATAEAGKAVVILEHDMKYSSSITCHHHRNVRSSMRLLRDVYEALGDQDNVERLEQMLAAIDTKIALLKSAPKEISIEESEDGGSEDEGSEYRKQSRHRQSNRRTSNSSRRSRENKRARLS